MRTKGILEISIIVVIAVILIVLAGCKTNKVSTDVSTHAELTKEMSTAHSVAVSSLFDSISNKSSMSIDSVIIHFTQITPEDMSCIGIDGSGQPDSPGKDSGNTIHKGIAIPVSATIYGINTNKKEEIISTKKVVVVEKDSMNRFKHWADSTNVRTEATHPPNKNKWCLAWNILPIMLIAVLLRLRRRGK